MLMPVLGRGIRRPAVSALLSLALGLAGGGSRLISSRLTLTVVGGLAASTSLALLVVPAGCSLLEGVRGRRKKKRCAG